MANSIQREYCRTVIGIVAKSGAPGLLKSLAAVAG